MQEYTIKQAAEILEVSTSTVRRKIKSGEYTAEKKESPYGEQYFIPATKIDQAVMENESINISQVNKPVGNNSITDKIDGQNKQLQQQNELIGNYNEEIIEKLDKQQEIIEQQSKMIRQLQEEKNKSLLDKIKNLMTWEYMDLKE